MPDSPIFILGVPGAGDQLLMLGLAHAAGVFRAQSDAATFIDTLAEVQLEQRGFASHRLTAADAPALGARARAALRETLVDREEHRPERAADDIVALAAGPRLALRVPFLDAVFPRARFVLVTRDPAAAVPEMLAAWQSQRFISSPDLPGWDGPPWSLPLIEGWRRLNGAPLEEIVVEQWRAVTELLLDDLDGLSPERWCVTDHAELLAAPRRELRRLCSFLGIAYDQALLTPLENARRQDHAHPIPSALAERLPRAAAAAARTQDLLAPRPVPAPARAAARPDAAFGSVSTASFAQTLARLRSSLLISTYQSGKLICAREQQKLLNTHFRDFNKPMGIAVADGRFALGTHTEVLDFRDVPAVAPKLEPPGTHDACYLPRNRHVTGDIAVHELAYANGELWLSASAFSCLATLDAAHSIVPRWKPPFVSAITLGDRCHLNGIAVVDDRVRYVTALGRSDEPGGWRAGKADGGVVLEVPSGEIVAAGLSMPHSPRWHDNRLWVLESGRGQLCQIDPANGRREAVVELPGFTRGLAFAGRIAFVGLSQIRESSTFGDLPLVERLQERVCGVWMIDLGSGEIAGFLRFDDVVQEIFDVALLPGKRFPEIAEPGSTAVATSFDLP